jgi:hypothetical protein
MAHLQEILIAEEGCACLSPDRLWLSQWVQVVTQTTPSQDLILVKI